MRVPNIFNMPNVQSMLQPNSGNSFTVSGQPYNGPFGQDTRTPFRTINNTPDGRGAGAYGNGLNASAAQLYDHLGAMAVGQSTLDCLALAWRKPLKTLPPEAIRRVAETLAVKANNGAI